MVRPVQWVDVRFHLPIPRCWGPPPSSARHAHSCTDARHTYWRTELIIFPKKPTAFTTRTTYPFYTFLDHVPSANDYWFDQRSLAWSIIVGLTNNLWFDQRSLAWSIIVGLTNNLWFDQRSLVRPTIVGLVNDRWLRQRLCHPLPSCRHMTANQLWPSHATAVRYLHQHGTRRIGRYLQQLHWQ